MHWRANLIRTLTWTCLILAVAAYGSVVVRNVTDTLMGIAHQQPIVVVEQPRR